jgi:hypothetical protein
LPEALAVEEYRAGPVPDQQFRRLSDVSRFEADRILIAHRVWLDYTQPPEAGFGFTIIIARHLPG